MSTTTVLIASVAKILFVLLVVVGVFAPVLVWQERRQSAMIQDRVGPHRAGIPPVGQRHHHPLRGTRPPSVRVGHPPLSVGRSHERPGVERAHRLASPPKAVMNVQFLGP